MKFKNDQPFIEKGLEQSQVSFSGGRTAASIAEHGGITHIDYYGNQRFGDVKLYKGTVLSAWTQLFRTCVKIDGKTYMLKLNNTLIYPFGYASLFKYDEIKLAHGMYLLNDAIVFTLEIINNPDDAEIIFEIIQNDTCTRIDKASRTWTGPDEPLQTTPLQSGMRISSIVDSYPKNAKGVDVTLAQKSTYSPPEVNDTKIWLGLTSDLKFSSRGTSGVLRKYYYDTEPLKDKASFSLAFGHQDESKLINRIELLQKEAYSETNILKKNYNNQMKCSTQIKINNETVQSLINNAAPILDSLKVKDIAGGMRAADSGYWIWGWDSMVHADAFGYLDDTDFLVKMLEFYRKTADAEFGIFHEMTVDQRPSKSMEFPAQCLYVIMLQRAYAFSGDSKLLDEYLPFSRWIIDKAAESEIKDCGLIKGVSLYPDHPEDLEQDGNDLSVFNNSIYYQALCIMAELLEETGEHDAATTYKSMAMRTLKGFQKFYDEEKHYFYDSISSVDFSPRRHYPLYAILWVTEYAMDIVGDKLEAVAEFMKNSFPSQHGLLILPKWDSRFLYDGSQLAMTMPVIENFYYEVMKASHNYAAGKELFNNMEWAWNQLTIIESLTCEYENHGITLDNPGRKQAFCLKALTTAFYRTISGIKLSCSGITFSVFDSDDIAIYNLFIRGKKVDLKITGRGWQIKNLQLNNEELSPSSIVAYEKLKEHNIISIKRGL